MGSSDVHYINVGIRKDFVVRSAWLGVFRIGRGEDVVDEFLSRGNGSGTDGCDEVLDVRSVAPGENVSEPVRSSER